MQTLDMMRFRCLSHEFSVVADRPFDRSAVSQALEPFRMKVDADEPTVRYELRDDAAGRYSLVVDGQEVRISDDPAEPLDLLLWYVGEHTVLAETRLVLLHAGAVLAADGRAMLLPGPSGSGKSTTTLGLVRAGFGYLSDEFAVLDPETAEVSAFPRPLALKQGTRALLPAVDGLAIQASVDPAQTVHLPADRVGIRAPEGTFATGWVVFPRYQEGSATVLTELSPGEACIELVRSTFQHDGRAAEVLGTMARISRGAAAYRLTIGDLDEAVEVLTALTTGPGATTHDRRNSRPRPTGMSQ